MKIRTWILLAVAVLVAVAVVLAVASGRTPAIASKAVGTWREVSVSHPQTMTVKKTAVDRYAVRYPAVRGAAPWIATLQDDHLTVWGENAISDPRYEITYDQAHDQLVVIRDGVTTRLQRTSAAAPETLGSPDGID